MTWMQTASGRVFDLLNPTFDQVAAADIVEHLSRLPRFNGAAGTYSVAQHSLHVAERLPLDLIVWGLLHDAHEAYLGDDTRPKIAALAAMSADGGEALRLMRANADGAIFQAFGLPPEMPEYAKRMVKHVDARMLATEGRDLMLPPPRPWEGLPDPYPETVEPDAHAVVSLQFEEWLREYAPRWPE